MFRNTHYLAGVVYICVYIGDTYNYPRIYIYIYISYNRNYYARVRVEQIGY